tara:strand:+ start:101 stop:421 length:321 start_codon:yes stop_codon:yes gene_type:complete
MKEITKFISIFIMLLFMYSCSTAKDALVGKKRSEQGDEFLIDKKNPLTMPPDFEKLPVPGDLENIELSDDKESESEIKDLLKIEDTINSNNEETSSDLESLIIKKL